MRKIKFRGKDCRNGKWYYGSLHIDEIHERTQIWLPILGCSDVIPETVGQFIGLYDKDGKEIYEGDILDFNGITVEVRFIREVFAFLVNGNLDKELYGYCYGVCRTDLFAKVIGNVYEDHELLKEESR